MTRTPESHSRFTPLGHLALIGLLKLDIDPPFIHAYANDACTYLVGIPGGASLQEKGGRI